MKKGFIGILIFVFLLSLSTVVLAEQVNPFTDVPAGHWAYGAIEKLSQAGIIDGYGDGTFRGDRLLTRFEMAQTVAKAMARSDEADAEMKALIDKLAVEFAAELKRLGVRVQDLEKKTNIALNYESRIRFIDDVVDTGDAEHHGRSNWGKWDWRQRIYFSGPVNDKVTYGGRISMGNVACNDCAASYGEDPNLYFDQMYFNIHNVLGDNLTLGRLSGQGVTNGLLSGRDNNYDGAKLIKYMGLFKFTGLWSVQSPDSEVGLFNLDYIPTDNLRLNIGYQLANWTDHPWKYGPTWDELDKSWDFGLQYKVGKYWLTSEWVRTKRPDVTENSYGLQITNGQTGFFYPVYNLVDPNRAHTDAFALSYRKMNGYSLPGGISAFTQTAVSNWWGMDRGEKGFFYTYQSVFSKGVVWTVEYQAMDEITGDWTYKTWNSSLQFFF